MKKEVGFYFVGFILLAVSFYYDRNIVDFVQLIRNPVLDVFFNVISDFGSLFIVLFIISALFLWKRKKREWVPAIWVSFLVTAVLVLMLKFLFARERPFVLNDTSPISMIFDYLALSSVLAYSFPSLHSAAAFTALPVLNKEFPKIKWLGITFAFLVLVSRVYLGAHYLSDCIFGAMLGYGVGSFIVYFEDKKRFFRKWIWR